MEPSIVNQVHHRVPSTLTNVVPVRPQAATAAVSPSTAGIELIRSSKLPLLLIFDSSVTVHNLTSVDLDSLQRLRQNQGNTGTNSNSDDVEVANIGSGFDAGVLGPLYVYVAAPVADIGAKDGTWGAAHVINTFVQQLVKGGTGTTRNVDLTILMAFVGQAGNQTHRDAMVEKLQQVYIAVRRKTERELKKIYVYPAIHSTRAGFNHGNRRQTLTVHVQFVMIPDVLEVTRSGSLLCVPLTAADKIGSALDFSFRQFSNLDKTLRVRKSSYIHVVIWGDIRETRKTPYITSVMH